MSKLIKTDAEYSLWIQELKERYRRSQIKAATQVNREMQFCNRDMPTSCGTSSGLNDDIIFLQCEN